jgi:hypothetical protein
MPAAIAAKSRIFKLGPGSDKLAYGFVQFS